MRIGTAYAVLAAERAGNRDGFSFGTRTTTAGPARRGWFRHHTTSEEFVAPTWPAAVALARQVAADVEVDNAARDAEIASAVASGTSAADVAVEHDLSPARVGQIARSAGVETRPGRRPTGAATHHTARGRALLAQLVAAAAAAGVEPEAYLERLGAIDRAIGGLGRIGLHPSGDELRAALPPATAAARPGRG